jgi:hypothetical protein
MDSSPAARTSSSQERRFVIESLEARIAPATFIVTTVADSTSGSLRNAVELANENPGADEITFLPGLKGTVRLLESLPAITDSVTISAPGPSKLKVDGRGEFQLISIDGSGMEVAISGLKLTGGEAANGGAIYINNPDGTVTLTKLALKGNRAIGDGDPGTGGGINAVAGTVNISKSKISGNKAGTEETIYVPVEGGYVSKIDFSPDGGGGGIFVWGAAVVTLKKTVVSGNTAAEGGGIANYGYLVVEGGSKILKNTAKGSAYTEGRGGGILNGYKGTLEVEDSRVKRNVAQGARGSGDGGIYSYAGPGGSASGGGIFNANEGTVSIISSKISGNIAIGGVGGTGARGPTGEDAIYSYASDQRRGGRGGVGGTGGDGGNAYGGGIANEGILTVRDSKITGNASIGGAGGKGGIGGRGGQGAPEVPEYIGEYESIPHQPPGPGGFGGPGGKGGKGGTGIAGGILDPSGGAVVTKSTISGNVEIRGTAGLPGETGNLGKTGEKYDSGGPYYR